ncbi:MULTISPECIES: type II secretion system protein N [unclassified Sphingomonas]|uniref:type II secretion system protein N n=1 Tax=unclassified Sphingomonas TaxID=196159 RepID=UPI00226A65F9|nr:MULTISPECIES: type II secretion system protein N [unclassified Sphingomonas]
MRRIRLTTTPAVLFGLMMVIALILFLPMRLALGWAGLADEGFAARSVSGSVWAGRLSEAQFGDLALGSLDAGVSPLALLIGRARVSLRGRGGDLHGTITLSRHSQGVDDLTATLPTGRVFAPLPVTALLLEDVTVHFTDATCDKADGRVRATLVGEAGGIGLPPSVSGTARCDGGALLLPLASQAGTESVQLRITGEGRYTAVLQIVPADPTAAQRLAASGFIATAQGYRLSIEGSF